MADYNHHFISYSTVDAQEFAYKLHDGLEGGYPKVPAWLDKRDLKAGIDWDSQIRDAIRDCDSLLFVMTPDSVTDNSVCKLEWSLALRYKKPVVPILLQPADVPFRLQNRQYIDFSQDADAGMAKLREHLAWLASPAGELQRLKDQLADAERDLRRAADPVDEARIRDEMEGLKAAIARQTEIVQNPAKAAQRTRESIERGLERERRPQKPIGGQYHSKFINPPPGVAPNYFQDRHTETRMITDFLNNESLKLMTVVGRGGVGKTAMVCRLLKGLEAGKLPDDLGDMKVDGIVYLSENASRRASLPNLFSDLGKLLPDDAAAELNAIYKNPQATAESKMRRLLEHFPTGRYVVLLDNFEDALNADQKLKDAELDEALRTLLKVPSHAVKVIITTRVAPRDLLLEQPQYQPQPLYLDEGLGSPYAENILKEMDSDGVLGLKNAPDDLLNRARERTRGFPRALEALVAILRADRYTTLEELLARDMPENVTEALVGEAFNRLDIPAQRVMQALAVYGRPVPPVAVDYLLQPYLPGLDSAPVLTRLANMHFARRETGRFYLHPVDRQYALALVPKGEDSDRFEAGTPVFSQIALAYRGAQYFASIRKPREDWKTIEDLRPQLDEFDLRCEAEDWDTAINVLVEFDYTYLLTWGYYNLMLELHKRVEDKSTDPELVRINLANIGIAYNLVGKISEAIEYQERALEIARQRNDSYAEGSGLIWLAIYYSQVGKTEDAIRCDEAALKIANDINDTYLVGHALSNLGQQYSTLGDYDAAIDYFTRSLDIRRKTDDPRAESIDLSNIADQWLSKRDTKKAAQFYADALTIANQIQYVSGQASYQSSKAICHLLDNELDLAREAIDRASQAKTESDDEAIPTIMGVIVLRGGDIKLAHSTFTAAVQMADKMLANNAQAYFTLDNKAISLAGLAICASLDTTLQPASPDYVEGAKEAFRAAWAITSAKGVVERVLMLFDALALADTKGVLAGVRAVITGGG